MFFFKNDKVKKMIEEVMIPPAPKVWRLLSYRWYVIICVGGDRNRRAPKKKKKTNRNTNIKHNSEKNITNPISLFVPQALIFRG
jgi:hypothetical protein